MEVILQCGTRVFIDKEDAIKYVGIKLYVTTHGYVGVYRYGEKSRSYLHREITAAKSAEVVDHINGNKRDNRRSNVRVCAQADNTYNKKINSRNKTGVTGVRWDNQRLKWAVQISHNNKTMSLGRFDDFDSAVNARRNAEIKYHGEYAAIKGAQREEINNN